MCGVTEMFVPAEAYPANEVVATVSEAFTLVNGDSATLESVPVAWSLTSTFGAESTRARASVARARTTTSTDPESSTTAFSPASESTTTGDASDHAKDRVTKYVYNDADQIIQQVALDASGDGATTSDEDQATTYVFAIELADKGCPVKSNARLRAVIYPDSDDTVASDALADNGEYDRVELTYYADGSRKTVKDPRGVVRTFTYDDRARLLTDAATTIPGGSGVDDTVLRIVRAYDALGRLDAIASYDAASAGNVVNEVAYTYDAWGNVTKSEQEHDGEVDGSTAGVEYAYEDGASGGAAKYVRLDSVAYPNGRVVYYNYPASGIGDALSRVDTLAAAASPTAAQTYAEYTYLGKGTIVRVAHPATRSTHASGGDGLVLDFGTDNGYDHFDRLGRVVEQTWTRVDDNGTAQTLDSYTYGYDRASNCLYRKNETESTLSELYHADNATAGQEYDGLGRLTMFQRGTLAQDARSITTNVDHNQAWTLDALGNWPEFKDDDDGDGSWDLDQNRAHNKVNEIAGNGGDPIWPEGGSGGWVDPVYDAAGNMTFAPRPGDETTATEALHLVYDAWNRLAEVWEDDGDGTFETNQDTCTLRYRYDGLGRRIRRLYKPPIPFLSVREYYFSTAWQVLEERSASVSPPQGEPAVATAPVRQTLWDLRYLDAPVLMWHDLDADGTLGEAGEVVYACTDANFNVTALVRGHADDAMLGQVAERYVYEPYGAVTVYNGGGDMDFQERTDWSLDSNHTSDWGNTILYCGYRFDPETGLYHVRHRVLHPTLGRWVQRDPIGYADGMSLYEHVGSRPVGRTDPGGLTSVRAEAHGGLGLGPKIRVPGTRNEYEQDQLNIPSEQRYTGICDAFQRDGDYYSVTTYPDRRVDLKTITVNPCTVMVWLVHTPAVFVRMKVFTTEACSAFGLLACDADSTGVANGWSNRPAEDPYGESPPAYSRGQIPQFPIQEGPIGDVPEPPAGVGRANAGFGAGMDGFMALMDDAWRKAREKARAYAKDKACCVCRDRGITVVLIRVADSEMNEPGYSNVRNYIKRRFCDSPDGRVCKKEVFSWTGQP